MWGRPTRATNNRFVTQADVTRAGWVIRGLPEKPVEFWNARQYV